MSRLPYHHLTQNISQAKQEIELLQKEVERERQLRKFNENYRLVASEVTPTGVTVVIRPDSNTPILESKTETNQSALVRYCKDRDKVSLVTPVDVSQLKQQCRNIEEELDQVKYQIVKIVTDKNDFSKENAFLKSSQSDFATLTEQNERLKQKLEENSGMLDLDRTSPDGQEIDGDQMTLKSSVEYEAELQNIKDRNKQLEDENKLVTKKLDSWKDLEEKNKQLEESLDLIREEFESMEDYWQEKLDQERKFYEEQLKFSERQFKDLEHKMKEYDEILLNTRNAPLSSQDEDDKLSTIEETFSLECQVTRVLPAEDLHY